MIGFHPARGRGTLLVELLYVLLLWTVAVVAFVALSNAQLARRRANAGARLLILLASSGAFTQETVDRELASLTSVWRRNGPWRWNAQRFLGSPSARFYRLTAATVESAAPKTGQTVVMGEVEP